MTFDPWKHQLEVLANRDRTADNSGRFATTYAHADTVGAGELLLPDAALFGLRYLSKPGVAYGFEVDPTTPPVVGRFPRADGFVYGWETDEAGYYVGAYLGLAITSNPDVLTDSGEVTVPVGSLAAGASPLLVGTVTFATTFLAVPDVTVAINGTPGGTQSLVARLAFLTATSFNVYLYNAGAATATWGTAFKVGWVANQPLADLGYSLHHTFAFSGTALKTVPEYLIQ